MFDLSTFRCTCPTPSNTLTYYQTSLVINLTLGYCVCPQGIITNPSQQTLTTYNPTLRLCKCPNKAPTNTVTQIRAYYDSTLFLCQCYAPTTALIVNQQWALVWNSTSLVCECPHNSMYNSGAAKRYCTCTTVTSAPVGTVKPAFNTTSGNCQCPTGTTINYTSKVCVCPTGKNWNGTACA